MGGGGEAGSGAGTDLDSFFSVDWLDDNGGVVFGTEELTLVFLP